MSTAKPMTDVVDDDIGFITASMVNAVIILYLLRDALLDWGLPVGSRLHALRTNAVA